MQFYVLETNSVSSEGACYRVVDGTDYTKDAPKCPTCGMAVGSLRGWQPRKVTISRAKRMMDFIDGAGGPDFLVTERLLQTFNDADLKGFEETFPVEVLQKRTKKPATGLPNLYGVNLIHSRTRVDYDKMETTWMSPPKPDHCKTCGPGGGGDTGGYWDSYERIVFEEGTYGGEDIFYPMNFCGTIILSQRAVDLINENNFKCNTPIPIEEHNYCFLGIYGDKKKTPSSAIKPDLPHLNKDGSDHVKVVGIYKLPYTKKMLHEQTTILHQPKDRLERKIATRQVKEQLDSIVLIEVIVENPDDAFKLSHFTQQLTDRPPSSWQAPWCEAYLTPTGDQIAPADLETTAASYRICFYLHFFKQSSPLVTSYGLVSCPPVEKMPKRLAKLVPYELLD